MSIAASLAALAQAKTDIASAITAQGGTVGEGDGFADFAADIATIATGVKMETEDYEVTASGGVNLITHTLTDITTVSGAILVYHPASTNENHRGMHTNVRIGDVTFGSFGPPSEGSSVVYSGTNYGSVLFPSEGYPSVRFTQPSGTSLYTNVYKAGTYTIVIWGS